MGATSDEDDLMPSDGGSEEDENEDNEDDFGEEVQVIPHLEPLLLILVLLLQHRSLMN
jgi:hypothetical protein